MRPSGGLTMLVSLLIAMLAMAGAGRLVDPINRQRSQLQLNFDGRIGRDLPPEMAITQAALGTFRGVAVNILWQRAGRLKEQGKFYEAMQLADWITTLQPRFPQVWEFNSWNMAYNISVATHTPEERWMWVDAGVRLLRDKGIPSNPRSLKLYRQLGWILLHKIGDDQDNMHWYYKVRFAEEWHALLGAPPPGLMTDYEAWFRPVAEGSTPEGAAKARTIREKYHMDPALMLQVASRYGPLDWRHPGAHAVYWASAGLQNTADRHDPLSIDTTNTDRLVFHGIQQLAFKGRVFCDPESHYFGLLPDPRFINAYDRAFAAIAERDGETAQADFRAGYQTFLEWAVRLTHTYGDHDEARRLYERLRSQYGGRNGAFDRYLPGIEEFVVRDLLENLSNDTDARQFIAGQIFQAIVEGMANGQPELAERFLSMARDIHRWYVNTHQGRNGDAERNRLPPLPDLAADVLTQYLLLPTQQVDPVVKARVWHNAPLDLRRRAFPHVNQHLRTEASRCGLDPDKAFPTPAPASPGHPHMDGRSPDSHAPQSEAERR